MKLSLLILFTAMLSMKANDSFGQRDKISLDLNSATIAEVIDEIEAQTEFQFIFTTASVDLKREVSIKVKAQKIDVVLKKIFDSTDTAFEIYNRKILLSPADKKPQPRGQASVILEQQQIEGTVTDGDGLPLAGVTVRIEGTAEGTLTDFDGKYTIAAETGQTLVFSYVGLKEEKRLVGTDLVIDVQMAEQAEALEEVVVTALGIQKKRKAIGYAVTEVKQAAIEDRPQGDLARILTGKVAGLDITNTSGFSGSGTNIIIRGLSSIGGDNQALIVVDGVPFNNTAIRDPFNLGFLASNQSTNRAFDIDPNNIAKVEVLKGISAATLYGSRGANGVILITTKTAEGAKGGKRSTLSISQSSFQNTISTIPDYQDQFGQGDQGVFDPNSRFSWGPSFNRDGFLGFAQDPNIDDAGTFEHFFSGDPAFPELNGARLPFRPVDNFKNFFRTGVTNTTSIVFNGSSEDRKTTYNASFGYLDDQSFLPGNGVSRTNFSVGGSTKISDRLTVEGTMNYTLTDQESPDAAFEISSFGRSNIVANLLALPRSVDLFSFPSENPVTRASRFLFNDRVANPRWLVENTGNDQNTNRTNWRARLNYELADNVAISWQTGHDFFSSETVRRQNRRSLGFPGFLGRSLTRGTIWDHLLQINGKFKLAERLSLDAIIGGNARRDILETTSLNAQEQTVFGNFLLANFNPDRTFVDFTESSQNQVGAFGQFTFDYDGFLFLNAAVRSDWVSNLSRGFNNAIYPSVSLSFLPTTVFKGLQSEKGLNYLKLRGSYGTSTRFPTGFPADFNLNLDSNPNILNGITIAESTGTADAKFEPEIIREWELGLETSFFKNRGFLDLSLWRRRTEDIISQVSLPPSTGSDIQIGSFATNDGTAEAEGIEINLSFDIIKSKNFNWTSRLNFSSHNEILLERGDIFEEFGIVPLIRFGAFSQVATNAAIPGESLGALTGTRVERNEDGIPIVDADGNFLVDADGDDDGNPFILGDAIPDYRMNFFNSFTYKNWNLGVQVQHVKGGDIFSTIPSILLGGGLIKDNLFAHGNTFVIDAVTESGEPNTVAITPERYFRRNLGFSNTEFSIFDASVVRLQELSIGYSFPQEVLERTPFSSLNLTLSGNNLWHSAYNIPKGTNLDPNTLGPGIGNNRGLDYGENAGSRRYGLTLRASF